MAVLIRGRMPNTMDAGAFLCPVCGQKMKPREKALLAIEWHVKEVYPLVELVHKQCAALANLVTPYADRMFDEEQVVAFWEELCNLKYDNKALPPDVRTRWGMMGIIVHGFHYEVID